MPFDVYLQRPNLVSLYNSRPGQKKLRPGPPEVACLTLNVWSDGRSGRTSGAARTWLLPNQMTGALVGVAKASLYFSPVTSSQSLGTNVWLILFSIVRKCKTSRVALEEALWPLLIKQEGRAIRSFNIDSCWMEVDCTYCFICLYWNSSGGYWNCQDPLDIIISLPLNCRQPILVDPDFSSVHLLCTQILVKHLETFLWRVLFGICNTVLVESYNPFREVRGFRSVS